MLKVHGNPEPTPQAKDALDTFLKNIKIENAVEDEKLLSEYSSEFTIVDNQRIRKSKFLTYRCKYCELDFATNVKSICQHVEAHKNDEFIKVGVITNGKFKGLYRPSHHWFNTNINQSSWGTDCRLAKVIIPESRRKVEKVKLGKNITQVFCGKCDKFCVEIENINDENQLRSKARHIDYLECHEKKCDGVKDDSKRQ